MRKKIVRIEPYSPNVDRIMYADGSWGLRGKSGAVEEQTVSAPTSTHAQEEISDAAATKEEMDQIEAMLSSQRNRMQEEYGRDQRFREYSDEMAEIDSLPEGNPVGEQRFSEAIKKYPEYLKTMNDGQIRVEGYFLPEKKKGGS